MNSYKYCVLTIAHCPLSVAQSIAIIIIKRTATNFASKNKTTRSMFRPDAQKNCINCVCDAMPYAINNIITSIFQLDPCTLAESPTWYRARLSLVTIRSLFAAVATQHTPFSAADFSYNIFFLFEIFFFFFPFAAKSLELKGPNEVRKV